MTPHDAHHLWIRFVGLDNVAETMQEEWDALPSDLLEEEDAAAAYAFLQDWASAIVELNTSRHL